MNVATRILKPIDAMKIAGWTYDPPYDFYNMGGTEEAVNELLNGSYRVVESTDGQIMGFYCVGESVQLPIGHQFGAYLNDGEDVVDLGIGMRPDLTGKGFGGVELSNLV